MFIAVYSFEICIIWDYLNLKQCLILQICPLAILVTTATDPHLQRESENFGRVTLRSFTSVFRLSSKTYYGVGVVELLGANFVLEMIRQVLLRQYQILSKADFCEGRYRV